MNSSSEEQQEESRFIDEEDVDQSEEETPNDSKDDASNEVALVRSFLVSCVVVSAVSHILVSDRASPFGRF